VLESVVNDLASPLLRAKAVASLAGDLNIARRNWSAYPSGHPLIESSIKKLLESFATLCKDGVVVPLGITRDGLLLGEEFVEKNNQICRSVASVLFERGIGALIVLQPPNRSELLSLLGILALKREEVFAQGGVDKIWHEAGITALEVRAIRYDRFSGTEEQQLNNEPAQPEGSLWEQFVLMLMQGEVGLSVTDARGDVRPEVLAAALNAYFSKRMGAGSGLSTNTLRSTTTIIQKVLTSSCRDEGSANTGSFEKESCDVEEDWSGFAQDMPVIKSDLTAFITALDPVLRRQILNGFCETGPSDEKSAAELFRYLGPGILQESYATADEYASAPQMLQEILKKMLPHLVNSYETNASDDEIRDKMQTLLQEHQLEAYMPDGYMQGLLDALASGAIRAIEPAELDGLFNTLSLQFIDRRGSEIILQLVVADPAGEGTQELIQSLSDLCGHFLELGDYGQVLKILSQAADPRLPQPLRIAMRDSFCRRDFLDEILSGLTIWGKPKYDQVSLLIQVLGRAFIEPLLDRMAEEENMSLRRFIMDRVQSFGSTARPSIIHRLSDPRWYVLRNLIIMLRTLEPAQDVDLLRPLLRHPNQKVRVEALKSLLLIGDPQAQRQIVRDLESSDRETQLIAINMADRNSSAEMVRKLIFLVNSGGYTAVECELKAAAVHALGEIGRPEILPELAKVLAARSLLSFKALSRLKIEIIRSFERYPVAASIPLLQRLATGNDDVARQSAESLKNLRSKPS
jgi:hypothetical protein